MFRIGVKKPPNHSLILRVVLPRLPFEELNAALAHRNRDLDALIPEDEVLRSRKEVTNGLQSPKRLIGVSDFRAHRLSFLLASSRGSAARPGRPPCMRSFASPHAESGVRLNTRARREAG